MRFIINLEYTLCLLHAVSVSPKNLLIEKAE